MPKKKTSKPAPQLLPVEQADVLGWFTDEQLDLYLKFKLLDAVPLRTVETEAKRRKVR